MNFNYDKNREQIVEYSNIVISLESYIRGCTEINMDEDFISRYQKTLDKYKIKLAKCHSDEKAYFAGIDARIAERKIRSELCE